MATSLEESWDRLVAIATQKAKVDAPDKVLPPDADGLKSLCAEADLSGGGASLAEFYGLTNGLDLSGYLPDMISRDATMPLSIIPVTDVLGMYEQNRQEQQEMDPEELEDCGDLWQENWLPFAWDGATGYQCVDTTDGRVVHYDLAAFMAQDCASSLAEWFDQVASRIDAGELEVFNI